MSIKRDPIHEAILRAGRGEKSPWPTDKKYPVKGRNHQERFRKGDKQALLWAIEECGQEGKVIPPWAADAFSDLMARACEGVEFETWDEVFGKIMASRTGRAQAQRRVKEWRRVGGRIAEIRATGRKFDLRFWPDLKGKFPEIGEPRLREYWKFYRGMAALGLI